MADKLGDSDSLQPLEEVGRLEDAVAERSTGVRGGRSRKVDEAPVEQPVAIEEGRPADLPRDLEGVSPEVPAAVEGQVMSGLTITELEMMPKLDDISKLEEIPVGGTTNIEGEVIGAIAGIATQSVQGVASLGTTSLRRTMKERFGSAERKARGVEVEVGRREVILDINLRVIYGYSIPRTVIEVREAVADRLLRLCGLIAKEINVRVTGIEFPQRMPGRVQ